LGKAPGRCVEYHDKRCRDPIKYSNQKKAWQQTVREVKKVNPAFSLQAICRLFGYSVQAYHKGNQQAVHKDVYEKFILEQIDSIRKHQPRCGGRKLFLMLQPFLKQHDIVIGRDKFFALLKGNGLLVRKTKRCVYTTHSKHFLYRYPNLIKDFVPLKAHELL